MTTRPLPSFAASRRTALAAAAVCLLFAAPLRAAPEYLSLAGLQADGFQKWIDETRDQGYRPVYVNGYDAGDHVEFAGVAIKDDQPWEAKYNLTAGELQKAIDENKKKGLRPGTISGYLSGKRPRFTVTFIKDRGNVQWDIRHNITHKDYIKELHATQQNGLRPHMVSGYADADGDIHFTTLFVRMNDKDEVWDSPHDMSEDKFQDKIDQWKDKGLRPTDISVYDTPDGPGFTAVGLKWDSSPKGAVKEWVVAPRHDGPGISEAIRQIGGKRVPPHRHLRLPCRRRSPLRRRLVQMELMVRSCLASVEA